MYEPILHEEFSILNASELCKILGDYNRMRLLLLLSDTEERTISEIAAKLQSSLVIILLIGYIRNMMINMTLM